MIQKQLSLKPYEPFILYPTLLKAKYTKKENKFCKFLKIFKTLNVNDPFANTIVEMPSCAKSLKVILCIERSRSFYNSLHDWQYLL